MKRKELSESLAEDDRLPRDLSSAEPIHPPRKRSVSSSDGRHEPGPTLHESSAPSPAEATSEKNLQQSPKPDSGGRQPFEIRRRILGNDSLRQVTCTIAASLCDLCAEFVDSFLQRTKCPIRATDQLDFPWAWKSYAARNEDVNPVYMHYSSVRALDQSARHGCALCKLIFESPTPTPEHPRVLIDCFSPPSPWFWIQSRYVTGWTPRYKGDDNRQMYEFALAKDEAECLNLHTNYGNARDHQSFPSFHSGSNFCFDQIRTWAGACASHSNCIRSKYPLPKRLLEVTGSATDGIVLRHTEQLKGASGLQYVALSYCWGGMSAFTTVTDNVKDREHGIELLDLPNVIRDAVRVVRECGIAYLWVDALCICQDDKEEWATESVAMANIYGGSVFTISALSSPDVHHSFLADRSFRVIPVGEAHVSYGSWTERLSLFVRKTPRELVQDVNSGVLKSRAWPFQERILAPAVLHFGRDQMLWECNTEHLVSETGARTLGSEAVLRLSDVSGAHSNSVGKRDLWDCIVEDYSPRKLTINSDRLAALTGLVAKLRADGSYTGRFAAGLWESLLDVQLCWSVPYSQFTEGSDVQPNLEIPTWSWARWNLPVVMFLKGHGTSYLQSPAQFRFSSPEEELQSRRPGPVVPCCDIFIHGYIQDVGDSAIRLDGGPLWTRPNIAPHYPGLPGEGSRWHFDSQIVGPGPHYCLRMRNIRNNNPPSPLITNVGIVYLVLERAEVPKVEDGVDTSAPSEFRRIGVLILNHIPAEHFDRPYPDVLFGNGRPLLTNGRWQDVVLR